MKNRSSMTIQTGKGTISLKHLLAIWSISAIASLPGLAISPILDDLHTIFPHSSELELQLVSSLPSLLIIPFVLLAGKLTEGRERWPILMGGLALFLMSGVGCLLSHSLRALLVWSCVMGIGAGMVIPLSTGLVAAYFTGDWRVRQLGYASAINNLTLVGATLLTSYLATRSWHLPFLVYLLPAISMVLCLTLRNQPEMPEPNESLQLRQRQIDGRRLMAMMALYLFITYAVLVVSFDSSFHVAAYHIDAHFSGWLIAAFFLAIMLPGLVLNSIIRRLRSSTNQLALLLTAFGLAVMGYAHSEVLLMVGAISAGLGYGVMQPIIYDKTATIAPPHQATLALSCVMAMNYLAVLIAPLLLSATHEVLHLHGEAAGFRLNALLVALLFIVASFHRKGFALGLDERYFVQ